MASACGRILPRPYYLQGDSCSFCSARHELVASPSSHDQPSSDGAASSHVISCHRAASEITATDMLNVGAMAFPKSVHWPIERSDLVKNVGSAERGLFWEIFAGSAPMSTAFSYDGWVCARVDAVTCPGFNSLDPGFLSIVLGLSSEGRCMLAPPLLSIAKNMRYPLCFMLLRL